MAFVVIWPFDVRISWLGLHSVSPMESQKKLANQVDGTNAMGSDRLEYAPVKHDLNSGCQEPFHHLIKKAPAMRGPWTCI